ncbi:MAG TPA: LapA family protein [Mycobacterium sp.]|nr:LapA family protein [Mycobacterium sp.]HTX94437.1 LapA family protein [Mycobacterium sp.]
MSHVGPDRTHRRTDESVRDSQPAAGLVIVAGAVLAFVVCVTNFALGQAATGVDAAIVALLGFGAGLAWVAMDRRRIRQAEREWPISHTTR